MTNNIHISICPICDNKEFRDFLSCKDYYATGEKFGLIECCNCGFVATQDFPSEDFIGKYYNVPDYISHSDTHKGIVNKLYHIARKIALRSKAKTVVKYSEKKKGMLLDIGCGTGYFLDKMKHKGWIVAGIEKDDEARKYAKKKFDLNTQTHDYFFQIVEKQKNVITMWHVLEHLEHLDETMKQLYRILKDDGVVIIALPNRNSLDAKHYKEYWAAYDVPRHLWHFSPNDFEYLANKHNFKLVKKKPMYFDAFYISMLSEKYKGTFASTIVGLIRGGVFFLGSLFDKNKCSSVIYILSKK